MHQQRVRDWSNECRDSTEWNAMLKSDKLVIADCYSAYFGHCSVYTSVIHSIMISMSPDQRKEVEWTRLDLAKLQKGNKNEPLKCLQEWQKYEQPQPLFVFIKHENILGKLCEANGGALTKMVNEFMAKKVKTPSPEPVDDIIISAEDDEQNDEKQQEEEQNVNNDEDQQNDVQNDQNDDQPSTIMM